MNFRYTSHNIPYKNCLLIVSRSFTAEQATKLSLTGFVKNASDGTVVGEAQGSSSNLDKFVQHLNMGPRAAKVENVEQKDIGSKDEESKFDQ